jgi:hypothetical protein
VVSAGYGHSAEVVAALSAWAAEWTAELDALDAADAEAAR